jgi:hypothetical protein
MASHDKKPNVVPMSKDTHHPSMTGVGFATQANTNIKARVFLCLDEPH